MSSESEARRLSIVQHIAWVVAPVPTNDDAHVQPCHCTESADAEALGQQRAVISLGRRSPTSASPQRLRLRISSQPSNDAEALGRRQCSASDLQRGRVVNPNLIMQAFLGHPAPPDPGARPSASDAHPSLKRLYIGVAPERTSTQRARSFSVTSGGSSSNLARSRAVSFSATAKDGSEKVTPPGRSRSSTVSSSRRGRGGAVGANEALLWDSATYEIGAGYRPKRPDDSLQVPIRPSLAPLAPVDAPIPPQTVEPPTTAQSEQAQVPSAKPRLEQMRPSDLPANQLRRKTVQFGELVEGHAHAHVAENGVAHDAVGDVKTDPPTASTSESRPPATESDRGTLPSSIIRVDRMLAKIQWIPRQGLPRFYDEKASRRYDPVDDPFEGKALSLARRVFVHSIHQARLQNLRSSSGRVRSVSIETDELW